MRLALLISGSGTTAEAVIKACRQKRLTEIRPVVVISSRPDTPGIQKAEKLAVKTVVVRRKDFLNQEEFGKALLTIFEEYDSGDLIRVVPIKIPYFGQPVTVSDLKQNPQPLEAKKLAIKLFPKG